MVSRTTYTAKKTKIPLFPPCVGSTKVIPRGCPVGGPFCVPVKLPIEVVLINLLVVA